MYTDTHRLSNQKAVTRGNITYNIRIELIKILNSVKRQSQNYVMFKLCFAITTKF